jgi:hypothetical protein
VKGELTITHTTRFQASYPSVNALVGFSHLHFASPLCHTRGWRRLGCI